MSDWLERLTTKLEPLLGEEDPRKSISSYHDMPYAIFRYPPEEEFGLRKELSLLRTRLEQKGKRVSVISLAERLQAAISAESSVKDLVDSEKTIGLTQVIDTVHEILSSYRRLDDLVVECMPADPDPLRDIVFIVPCGSAFPTVPNIVPAGASQGARSRSERTLLPRRVGTVLPACVSWECWTRSTITGR